MDPVEEGQRFGRLAITGRTSGQRYLPKGALIMKVYFRLFAILAGSCLLAVSALGEAAAAVGSKTAVPEKGFTLTETYEGSADTDGFVSDINSSAGYVFNPHFSINMGVSYLFINPSTSKTGTTSTSGMGNPSLRFRYSTKGPLVDFSTGVNGAFPVASSAKGLSTGRVTFDWDNHFAHGFDLFTPFLDVGVANSVPDTRFLKRPYTSLGTLAHFEGGSEIDLGDKFSVSASGYYILPWGTQEIFVRGKKSSPGSTKGGASLTRDDGINLGLDYNLTRSVDLSAGYSYSAYNVVNTVSFGVELNVASLLKKRRGE
jgi:hypothetical protein